MDLRDSLEGEGSVLVITFGSEGEPGVEETQSEQLKWWCIPMGRTLERIGSSLWK